MINLCGCKHAAIDDGGGGVTWNYVCKLTKEATDPNKCSQCNKKEEKK